MSQALPGMRYCLDHQGNHAHYDKHNCDLCKALRGTVQPPSAMTHDEKLAMCEMMERHGGGFVVALALCMRRADSHNLKRLYAAFPDYLITYGPDSFFQRHG